MMPDQVQYYFQLAQNQAQQQQQTTTQQSSNTAVAAAATATTGQTAQPGQQILVQTPGGGQVREHFVSTQGSVGQNEPTHFKGHLGPLVLKILGPSKVFRAKFVLVLLSHIRNWNRPAFSRTVGYKVLLALTNFWGSYWLSRALAPYFNLQPESCKRENSDYICKLSRFSLHQRSSEGEAALEVQ